MTLSPAAPRCPAVRVADTGTKLKLPKLSGSNLRRLHSPLHRRTRPQFLQPSLYRRLVRQRLCQRFLQERRRRQHPRVRRQVRSDARSVAMFRPALPGRLRQAAHAGVIMLQTWNAPDSLCLITESPTEPPCPPPAMLRTPGRAKRRTCIGMCCGGRASRWPPCARSPFAP